MKKLSSYIVILAGLVIAGGAAFLATWDIPAPVAPVEEVVPNDRFPK